MDGMTVVRAIRRLTPHICRPRISLPRTRWGLGGFTEELARFWGEKPALLREDGTAISFRELHRLTDLTACTLIARHDLRKGDRVIIPSQPLSGLISLLGVVKAGGVAVPLPSREGADVLEELSHHCRSRLFWDGSGEILPRLPGGIFLPYTRKREELAALAYRRESGSWLGTMLDDRSLLAAGFPLSVLLGLLGAKEACLDIPLNRSAGVAWALACLRAGVALSASRRADVWLSGPGMGIGLWGDGREARLFCHAGVLESRTLSVASLCLDGPCFDETCGFALWRLRWRSGTSTLLFWPLPHLRYRVEGCAGELSLGGRGLSWGYWGDMERSMRLRAGGWFRTDLRVRRVGPAFRLLDW